MPEEGAATMQEVRKEKQPSPTGERGRKGSGPGLAFLLAAVSLGACTPDIYRVRADRETYTTLFERTPEVENVAPGDLELIDAGVPDLSDLKPKTKSSEVLGSFASAESGARVLSLDQALEIGIRHGREYQRVKENLYLSALDLTLAKHRLSPIFFAGGSGTRATDSRAAKLEAGMNELVSTNTFARTQTAGFDWLLATGARLSTDFTQDFLRIMTGNQSVNESDLAVSLVQPLLQGGGTTVTLEALTQEQRNLLYDLRGFADFRRDYIVDLASDYYGVLRARDLVRNNYVAYQGFVKNVEREEALAEEDRRTQNQLGRLHQAKLISEGRWIDAARAYLTRLDEFKISIGIPVEERVVLDDRELERLRIEKPSVTQDQSLEIALASRPDLATARDLVVDAERHIKVAKNGLLPGLDLAVDYNPVSDPGGLESAGAGGAQLPHRRGWGGPRHPTSRRTVTARRAGARGGSRPRRRTGRSR